MKSNTKCKKNLQKYPSFDTICRVTKDRQKEADELSRNSDMMIVIGGKESSNTRKLFEISKRNCKHTYPSKLLRIYLKKNI